MAELLGLVKSGFGRTALLGCALVGCLMGSAPAAAQTTGARDLAGVRLGASPSEVESVLKALDATFKFQTIYYPDTNGKATSSIAVIKVARAGDDIRGNSSRRNGFAVYFTESNPQAYAIYREVANPQGISTPQVLEDITKKYGPTLGYYQDIYVRNHDAAGKPAANCSGHGFGWEGVPRAYDPQCGQALRVQFNPKAPGIAAGFQAWLFDHQLARPAIEAAQAKQQAAAQEGQRRQQEAVRANRPAI